jgi:hypothetical protein
MKRFLKLYFFNGQQRLCVTSIVKFDESNIHILFNKTTI